MSMYEQSLTGICPCCSGQGDFSNATSYMECGECKGSGKIPLSELCEYYRLQYRDKINKLNSIIKSINGIIE